MPMSEKRLCEDFAFMILFLVLNFQTCSGNYTCYPMSSGKDICFMLDASQRTFEGSKQFCQNNGGFLLEIYNVEMQRLVEQFGKHKTTYLGNAWLNLVRTNSNVWVWGGEGSGNYLNYANWETSNTASGSIIAFMNTNYKWVYTYSIHEASTICIKGNPTTYSSETSTATTTSTTSTTTTPTTPSLLSSSLSSSSTSSSTTTTTTTTTQSSSPSSTTTQSSPSSTTTTQLSLSSTSTSTIIPIMQPTQITATYTTTSSSASTIGIGVGVGLGGLVLIIVSSILIAKFVFHKEIPLPFKSSRNRKASPHQIGSDVTNGGYVNMDKNNLDERSAYAEVMMSDTPNLPPNSNLNYVGFQDMIQPNSASGLEGLSKADYETPQTFGKNIYDNAV